MIETYHLSKVYGRGVYALRDLTLTIDKGDFLFLTGASGAGKSTLLRLLLMAESPTEGTLKHRDAARDAQRVARTPLGRLGTVEDVADVIVWLISDSARFVNAEVITVDGGMLHTSL